MNEERYHLTRLSLGEFTNELDMIWSELKDPESSISEEANRIGIDLSPLRALKREDAILIERRESGLNATEIVMAFVAHGVVEVLKAAWIHLVLPRIKRDLGEDAIKRE